MSDGSDNEYLDYLLNNRSDFSALDFSNSLPDGVKAMYDFFSGLSEVTPKAYWIHRDNLPSEIPGGNENIAIGITATVPLGSIKAVSKVISAAPTWLGRVDEFDQA